LFGFFLKYFDKGSFRILSWWRNKT